MDYDVERSKQASEEIRKAFREIFPLTFEHDLPWAACHIKDFLRNRIEQEAAERVHHWQHGIVKVLCEVSPPKTHAVDMARIVVEKAKKADEMRRAFEDLEEIKKDRDHLLDCVRSIGKIVGCNHTEDRDGWAKLPQCVEESLDSALRSSGFVG